jgi:hypothetical protein
MSIEIETLTEEERGDVMELPRRQPGCPDKTCGVCRDNARRSEALAKALRILDAQAARIAEVTAELAELAFARQEMRKWNQEYDALNVLHAETRAELETAERTIEANENTLNEFRDGTVCTPAERKVLQEMAAMKHNTLSDVIRKSKFYKVCQAELAKRRGNT